MIHILSCSREKLYKLIIEIISRQYYFLEKIKRIIKFLYRKYYTFRKKTVHISYLIKRGDVIPKMIFDGGIYNLNTKYDINNKKFKYLPVGKYQVPDYFIYIIKNGLVKVGTNNIFSQDGIKITGINFQEMELDFHIIRNLKKIKIKYLDGDLLILGVGLIESNYSHAWTEFAARAYASKISKIKFDFILIDKKIEFLNEILNLIDLPKKNIIYSEDYEYIKARKIVYPELINNFKEYFLNGAFVYHRKYLPYWIKFLYDDVSRNVLSKDLNNTFEKIFISRKNKKERCIINELDLISNLNELGFKTVYFEDYSVVEQIRIMKEAKQIIAIHGAGLVNINFCKKGTKILELFPSNYQCAFFYMHSNMCGLKYYYYIGEPVNKLWRRSPIMENFFVDVERIIFFLKSNWN